MNSKVSEASIIKVMKATGATYEECFELLKLNDGNIDDAIIYLSSSTKYMSGAAIAKDAINNGINNSEVYKKMGENLSKYNTNRGGKNFKGFVFEDLHAANATVNGQVTDVIANNGVADFKIVSPNGKVSYGQAKAGYENSYVNFSKYQDQTLIVDKGNKALINRAKNAGCDVVESNISKHEAEKLASNMKLESKLTGNKTSTIVPKLHSTGEIAKQCHSSGVTSAKSGAAFGAGFSIGSNVVELIDGEKELGEVAVDVVKDTAIAAGTSYAVGALTTAVGSSAVGTAASAAIGTAGAAIASTTVGATAIGGATAAAATVTATGAAVSGAATAASAAIASSAVGTAVAGTATAVGSAVASSAVGTAAAAAGTAVASSAVGGAAIAAGTAAAGAVVAAAPVVLAGAAIGGVFTLSKKLFGK